MTTETRTCLNCKQTFTIEPEDFDFYEKIKVPPPTRCPQCRLVRRFNWHGYRVLYKRKCDYSGEMVISTYHPNSPYKVYKQSVWWSDAWDPKSYGMDIDWDRPFLEQVGELMLAVPHASLATGYSTMIGSEYCNGASSCKNCYLCFRITGGEDSAYLNTIVDAKQSFDCMSLNHSELSYGSVNISNCYQSFFSHDCEGCLSIWFSRDLVGCSNCVGCINLRQKQYCIFNEQYSKEEYKNKFDVLELGTHTGIESMRAQAEQFMRTQPRKQFHGIKNVRVSGDYISNSKNVRNSYLLANGQDLRYCQFLKDGPAASSYDWSFFGDNGELMYDCCWSGWDSRNVKFCSWNYTNHDIEYCFACHNSENLFGCVGIRKGQNCILNKQYPREEYARLVEKIREQMTRIPYRDKLGREYRYGEMLPEELSPWTYNESTAHEWFPLSKDETLARGFNWRDDDKREYREATMAVPVHIKDVTDEILKAVLKCSDCGKNYQIISMELQFLRRFTLPIPLQCPLCRDRARIRLFNPMAIYNRVCAKCGRDIETSYTPDRPEIVYCESCYNAEVV
jgi:DNA-directed RNA polymerase subunit RPC12/RpoP